MITTLINADDVAIQKDMAACDKAMRFAIRHPRIARMLGWACPTIVEKEKDELGRS